MKKTVKKPAPQNVVQKIIAAHLVEGDPAKDAELGIRIDRPSVTTPRSICSNTLPT